MASTTALSNKQTSELQQKDTVTRSPEPNQIAGVAYTLWELRGCPVGSPEEDWFKAEQELARPQARGATASNRSETGKN